MASFARPILTLLTAGPILAMGASAHSSAVRHVQDPLRFFEGRTEMVSTVKIVTKAPFRSHTLGRGQIHPDGSLTLLQQVQEDGKAREQRHWKMRQVAPGRFSGTMSDASGLVTAQEIGGRYVFRFKTRKGFSVEQWIAPQPGGKTATSNATVKRLGVRVATSTGTIRRL